ncbi:MAG TPA: HEAT repeat domain-containing protein [Candidatus Tectomicrobia bacterium]
MKRYGIGMLIGLVVMAWVGSGSARDIEPLVHDLRTGDEATRVRAVLALGHSGDAHAVEVLRHALHDESPLVRQYALQAFKQLLLRLAQTSRLVTQWLDDLLEQLEEPHAITAKPTTEPPRAVWSHEP